jgi:hypothetical protein
MDVAASVTSTVKLEPPRVFGVPLMAPRGERLSPEGNEPLVTVHE